MSEDREEGLNRWEWRRHIYGLKLAPMHRLVACALTEFVNKETGRCWPAVETLADMVAADERTVQRALTALVRAGALEVVEKGGGRKKTTVYQITIPRQDCQGIEEQNEIETVTAVTERVTETVTAVTERVTETVTAVTERVTAVSPEPSRTLGTYSEPADIEFGAPAEPDRQAGHVDWEEEVRLRLTDEPTTPSETKIADDKILWAWGSSWPSADEMVQPYPTIMIARTNVGYEASRLLGYTLESAKTYHAAHGEFPGATIIEAMGAVMHEELAQIMHRGELRKVGLARILANLGFAPLIGLEEETQKTQEEL